MSLRPSAVSFGVLLVVKSAILRLSRNGLGSHRWFLRSSLVVSSFDRKIRHHSRRCRVSINLNPRDADFASVVYVALWSGRAGSQVTDAGAVCMS